MLSAEKFGGYNTEVKYFVDEYERLKKMNTGKEERQSEVYGGLREDIGMKTYLSARPNGLRG